MSAKAMAARREMYLKHGLAVPRQDPAITATLMAAATSRIGIVPTFATFTHPPYLLARMIASLDQVSSGADRLEHGDRQLRRRRAQLRPAGAAASTTCATTWPTSTCRWSTGCGTAGSRAPIVADRESGVLVDHTKVHAVDFEGRWYRTHGPLNSGPCPQGRPVIAQAGGSPRGRQFAAQHADTIVASHQGHRGDEGLSRRRPRPHRARRAQPRPVKVLYLVNPLLARPGRSPGAARRARRRGRGRRCRSCWPSSARSPTSISRNSTSTRRWTRWSCTPTATSRAWTTSSASAGKKSLREAMLSYRGSSGSVELVGTPDAMAGQMAEAMQEVGGDGFLITHGRCQPPHRGRGGGRAGAGAAAARPGAARLRAMRSSATTCWSSERRRGRAPPRGGCRPTKIEVGPGGYLLPRPCWRRPAPA